jgi:methionyl-tRNA synthetase
LRAEIDAALCDFEFRRAVAVVRDLVDATNRRIDATRPWKLPRASAELDAALSELTARAEVVGDLLVPFLPDTAARVQGALTPDDQGRLPDPAPVVELLEARPR